jgi:hypothetical protein
VSKNNNAEPTLFPKMQPSRDFLVFFHAIVSRQEINPAAEPFTA